MTTLRTLWAAILMSAVMYGVMIQVLAPATGSADSTVVMVLGLMALPLALASQWIGGRLHAAAVEGLNPADLIDEGPDADAAGAHFRDAGPRRRTARDATALRKTAEQLFLKPFVVSCALADSVATLGLVVGILGGPRLLALGMVGLGVVLLARLSPSVEQVFGPVEQRLGISLRDGNTSA